jgi:glyceraldehyde 3-phosphate dehydrogenase
MTRVAINGFGRIGRLVLRAMRAAGVWDSEVELVAVGDIVPADHLAYLLKYDSTQGRFRGNVAARSSSPRQDGPDLLVIDGREVRVVSARTPAELPWKALGVEIVIEATGLFTDGARAREHLAAGARKVIVSAPAKNVDLTVVMGVNHQRYQAEQHHVVSNASCTTYGLAPLVYVLLREGYGVAEGVMTSVHSYTASQMTVDGPSRKDWKGGRAAAVNVIPASTGAAKAIGTVLPEVKGRLTGMSFRVPTPTVSVIDFSVRTEKETTLAEIRRSLEKASQSYLRGILAVTDEEVVSSDFVHDDRSSIYDAGSSLEVSPRFFKLVAWYDNEWAYANRCVDLLRYMAGTARYGEGLSPVVQGWDDCG